jgi:hypothetical protein
MVRFEVHGGQIVAMSIRPRPVHVLIDWNSEVRSLDREGANGAQVARRALKNVCRSVGRLLTERAQSEPFFIFLRVYHGWRRGFEPTERRRALEEARVYDPINLADRGVSEYSPSQIQVVRELEFGDCLLAARDERRCGPRLDHHLPSTLQTDARGRLGEKMVDTAIVSDLVYLSIEDDRSWLIVVGQDADLVPGILTAEGILQGTDRRVYFLARGGFRNSNPKIVDLICHR